VPQKSDGKVDILELQMGLVYLKKSFGWVVGGDERGHPISHLNPLLTTTSAGIYMNHFLEIYLRVRKWC
jgi:hypothetical protein